MEIILGLDQLKRPLKNPVVTLGNFDGVHLGHRRIFERVNVAAVRMKGEAVVVTFDPHPLKVLAPDRCPPLLTSFAQKMQLIEEAGVRMVLCLQFSSALSQMTPFDFVKTILIEGIGAKKVIVGYNYHFGKAQGGDVRVLKEVCRGFQVEVEAVEALEIGGATVSSSRIRDLIRTGQVDEASRLLGRDYSLIGRVVVGKRRGRTLGFPTANLDFSQDLVPPGGVYAVEAFFSGRPFRGVANIGLNPTFIVEHGEGEQKPTLEVHILSFTGDLYGQEIQVNFKKRIRDEVRFDSSSQLIARIREDIAWAEENVFEKPEQE